MFKHIIERNLLFSSLNPKPLHFCAKGIKQYPKDTMRILLAYFLRSVLTGCSHIRQYDVTLNVKTCQYIDKQTQDIGLQMTQTLFHGDIPVSEYFHHSLQGKPHLYPVVASKPLIALSREADKPERSA